MRISLIQSLTISFIFALGAGCRTTASFCGDGVRDAGEACDDGDNQNGDGCSASCDVENACGDGFLDNNEECDDGNNQNGDGCDSRCDFEASGLVSFHYVLLEPDLNGDIVAATSCNDIIDSDGLLHDIAEVRFMVGDDRNGNDILEDSEIFQEALSPCNQEDFDNNSVIDLDELGLFEQELIAGSFDLFAVEFIDTNNEQVLWETFDTELEAERFSFGGGVGFRIVADSSTEINFDGEGQLLQELQAFFGF